MLKNDSWDAFKKKIIFIYILFVVAILLTTTIINFQNVSDSLSKEIEASQFQLLEQFSDNIDSALRSVERSTFTAAEDSDIQHFFAEKDSSSPPQFTEIYNIQNQLISFTKNNNVESIYIYNKNTNYIISQRISIDFDLFPDKKWIEYCNDTENLNTWLSPRLISTDEDRDGIEVVTLLLTYPTSSGPANCSGFVVVNIDKKILTQSMQHLKKNQSDEFIIIDSENNIIFKSNISSPINNDFFKNHPLGDESSSIRETINGSKKTFFYTTHNKTGWKLINVKSFDDLTKSINSIRHNLFIVMAAMLFLTLLGLTILNKWMYSPIDKFITSIAAKVKRNSANDPITLNEISNIFNYMVQKQEKLTLQISESLPGMKWKIMTEILSDTESDFEKISESLRLIDYKLHPENFTVILFDIDNKEHSDFSSHDLDLYITAIENKAEELLNQEGLSIASRISDNLVAVLASFEEYSDNIVMNCISIIELVKIFMKNCFDITLTVAIGDAFIPFSSIHQSYYQAKELLKYKTIIGNNSILTTDDIKISSKQNIQVINVLLSKLEIGLKNNPSDCQSIIDNIFNEMVEQKLPRELLNHTGMQIIITILNNTNTSYIQKDSFDNDQYQNIYRCIINCETLDSMKQFISDILSEISEQYEKQTQAKTNNKLIETIISYINENYYDYNLSINFLSEKFSISPSYLCKSIKDYTKESFTDLLIKIRMQHAEQLLRTTSMKISVITEKVGYTNVSSFIRIFKKYYNMKPSEYRNNYIIDSIDDDE